MKVHGYLNDTGGPNDHAVKMFDKLEQDVEGEFYRLLYPSGFFENMNDEYRDNFAASSEFLDMGCEFYIKSSGKEKVVSCNPYVERHTFSSELGMCEIHVTTFHFLP